MRSKGVKFEAEQGSLVKKRLRTPGQVELSDMIQRHLLLLAVPAVESVTFLGNTLIHQLSLLTNVPYHSSPGHPGHKQSINLRAGAW